MTAPTASVRLNNDLPVGRFAELAAAAEDAGFDQVWVSHDLFWRSAPVLVAAAAAVTRRVGLGIGILNPYSSHPAELAMHAATLQELTGGRLLLGLGAGAAEFLGWAGIERPAPLARTRAAVTACRALLGGDGGRGVPEGWAPEARLRWDGPPPPIYLGAMGPRMLALAGEVADGALALSLPAERAVQAAAAVRAGAEAAGRDAGTLDVPACFWCSVDDDAERAAGPLAEKLAYYGPSLSPAMLAGTGLSPADFLPAADALHRGDPVEARRLVDPRMLRLGIAGDPAAVTARVGALQDEGFTHLSFGPPLGPDPVQAVARLGRHVLPALRAGAAGTRAGGAAQDGRGQQ